MKTFVIMFAQQAQTFTFPGDVYIAAALEEIVLHFDVGGESVILVDCFGNPLRSEASLDEERVEDGEPLHLVTISPDYSLV